MEGMESGTTDSSDATGSAVPLDRTAAGRIGITFARAAFRPVRHDTRVVGTLTYAEPRRQYVNARVMGWVERLDADYSGKPVRKGDALLALYSPELVSAQEEYLSSRRWRQLPDRRTGGGCLSGTSRMIRSIASNAPGRPEGRSRSGAP